MGSTIYNSVLENICVHNDSYLKQLIFSPTFNS